MKKDKRKLTFESRREAQEYAEKIGATVVEWVEHSRGPRLNIVHGGRAYTLRVARDA